MTNEPFVTLLGGEGYEISTFGSDILFAWPLKFLPVFITADFFVPTNIFAGVFYR